jgi:tRNA acetyltransferase TAN1
MNLIVTTPRGLEARASAELKEIILQSGTRKISIEKSPYDGVLEVEVENPRGLVAFLADLIRLDPFKINFIQRVIPVDRVVNTDLEDIKNAVRELSSEIMPGETFRITVESRDSPYSSKQLIESLAELIERKVNLESPDKVVLLQVFGEYTCISILRPQEILSVQKLKRGF